MSKRKHYLVYQINDNKNKKIYIGVHTTQNVNDGYMGSGVALQKAFKEHGIENFSKTILYDFDNIDEMIAMEAELVNREFIERTDTYNIILGGGFITTGYITVKDANDNYYFVATDDPRYTSGELKALGTGFTTAFDENGNSFRVSLDNPDYVSGKFKHTNAMYMTVKSPTGETRRMKSDDPEYLYGEYMHHTCNTVTVKDTHGKTFRASDTDPRYLSGELIGITKGTKLTKDHIAKIKESRDRNFQQGENNSQYGTMWIHNPETKQNKKIKKSDDIPNGWQKGRKIK